MVFCDDNGNGSIDLNDSIMADVGWEVESSTHYSSGMTRANGIFVFDIPYEDNFVLSLDHSSLPEDAIIIYPPEGEYSITTPDSCGSRNDDFLVDSAICRQGFCGDGILQPDLGEDSIEGTKDVFDALNNLGCPLN